MKTIASKMEGGFTIQETLVTLVVGSLLVSFCLSLYLSTSKLVSRWQTRTEERARFSRTLQVFYRDVHTSVRALPGADSLLVLERGTGREVAYRMVNDTLWRNDVSLGEFHTARFAVDTTASADGRKVDLAIETTGFKRVMSTSLPWSSRESFERAVQRGRR